MGGPDIGLSHVGDSGEANMVDISEKDVTSRVAAASSVVRMQPATLSAILNNQIEKGEVIAVARVAGIQAAKKCSELIPLCHPLPLDKVHITIEAQGPECIRVVCECKVDHKTGVEMEALTGASVAALTIYDMCKAIDKAMTIEKIGLIKKSGGKSGDWIREGVI